MQNLVTIPLGVSFPRMREIAYQNVYSASFFPGSSNSLQPRRPNRFSRVLPYVKRRGSAQGCAFSGLEDKILTFTPRNSRKTAILGPDFAGMWVSRPGLGLETDQDHFFEVLVLVSTLLVLVLVLASLVLVSACLVLVLVSDGGLEQDLRLCATATLLVSKVETSK